MLKVNKGPEPEELLKFKAQNKPATWIDYQESDTQNIKSFLKEHMLVMEQNEYCPYCERQINNYKEGRIEHIKPREFYPNFFDSYQNLLVSCSDKKTCDSAKKNKYSSEFIDPVLESPTQYLTYDLESGKIISIKSKEVENIYQRALYTIEVLNLNEKSLVATRKAFLTNLNDMALNTEPEVF
jgi:uncharacterized protein (TIGR02646 family)